MKKIIFIDRDGTIVKEPPTDFQVDKLEKIQWIPDVIPSLLELQRRGYELVMITNQDGLGTERFPEKDFQICQDYIVETLASQGIIFQDILICPHFPEDQCECRKPRLGLLTKYLLSQEINWKDCWVLGDRDTDQDLAKKIDVPFFRVEENKRSFLEFINILNNQERIGTKKRKTKETECHITVNLDNHNNSKIDTGLPFFDHMLEQLVNHGGIGLKINVTGDTLVDDHHTIEDTGITLGEALKDALGDKRGIDRYGFTLPMDEVLCQVSLDLSGRADFNFQGNLPFTHCGDFHTEMLPHFFKSFCHAAGINMHIQVSDGNTHHMIEACFKAVARSLKMAIHQNKTYLIPSSKGAL